MEGAEGGRYVYVYVDVCVRAAAWRLEARRAPEQSAAAAAITLWKASLS